MEQDVINLTDVKELMKNVMIKCSREEIELEVKNWFEIIRDEG